MNMAPISAPKTMIPPTAATQNVGRAAMRRSKSGFAARRWRTRNNTRATAAMPSSATARSRSLGTGTKLIPRMNAPTTTTDRMPPTLSTASVDSWMCAGMLRMIRIRAITASGSTTRKTDGQSKTSRSKPASKGPETEIAPPTAAHRAMARVRPGPGAQRAAMRDSVVG